jgi:hypothetical protein
MVSQNRNVQYFKKSIYLLTVTYAQAATWLHQSGHAVYAMMPTRSSRPISSGWMT